MMRRSNHYGKTPLKMTSQDLPGHRLQLQCLFKPYNNSLMQPCLHIFSPGCIFFVSQMYAGQKDITGLASDGIDSADFLRRTGQTHALIIMHRRVKRPCIEGGGARDAGPRRGGKGISPSRRLRRSGWTAILRTDLPSFQRGPRLQGYDALAGSHRYIPVVYSAVLLSTQGILSADGLSAVHRSQVRAIITGVHSCTPLYHRSWGSSWWKGGLSAEKKNTNDEGSQRESSNIRGSFQSLGAVQVTAISCTERVFWAISFFSAGWL